MRDTRSTPIGLLLAALLSLAGLAGLGACESQVEMTVLAPQDQDRQCEVDKGCRDGLLCVRLLVAKQFVDGGIAEASNYTCHQRCGDDQPCPTDYTCVRPMPPPMSAVCVREDVAARLNMDGGL